MSAVNAAADADPEVLRVSLDAKATVKVGPFSRRGTSRVQVQAADHDFQPEATVTPVGLFLPEWDEVSLYQVTAKVTSDCLVDCLTRWWVRVRERYAHSTMLVLNLVVGRVADRAKDWRQVIVIGAALGGILPIGLFLSLIHI